MPPNTRKQILIGYAVISALAALAMSTGWPWVVYEKLYFSLPRALFVLLFLLLLPGMVAAWVSGFVLAFLFWTAAVFLMVPIWILMLLLSSGVLGIFLIIPYAACLLVGTRIIVFKYGEMWLETTALWVRRVVEAVAWLDFMLDMGARRLGFNAGTAAERPQEGTKEEKVAEASTLELVRAEIVQLRENYPDLPAPPEAYHANRYEGWFAEARKRFEMQSYNRTQGERLEILKRIAAINDLYLKIARQEGEKKTFELEQRIRSKRLNLEEMEVDNQTEDLQYQRQQKMRERANPMPVTPPPSKPPDIVAEITSQLERAVRTELGIREVFGKYREHSPHLSAWLSEWEARVLWDLKERKWS